MAPDKLAGHEPQVKNDIRLDDIPLRTLSKNDVELAERAVSRTSAGDACAAHIDSAKMMLRTSTWPSPSPSPSPSSSRPPSMVSNLPPIDGGFGAWSFLAGAFVVDTVVWGFPTAYGTLLDAYLADPRFGTQPHATSLLALIGPIVSGVMHCASPAINPILYRFPHAARPLVWSGTLLCAAGLLASSFARTVPQLLALQGVIYAIGGSLIYVPTIFFMSQWFLARRGLANGVMFAGTSLGGVALPLALPPLIARCGIPTTLRILAGATFGLLLPFLPFVRGRRAPDRAAWWRRPEFLLLLATNTLQAFGYFVPLLWLPTFAGELDLSAGKASLTLTLLNATSAIGRLGTGVLSDRCDPWGLALGMLVLSALSALVLWGVLSVSFAGVLAFSAVYGVVSAGWATLWTGFIRPIAKDDPNLSTTLFGWLLLTRGLGNILSTPISTALKGEGAGGVAGLDLGFRVGGGKYESMIVYTGACFVGAAVVVIAGWGVDVKVRRTAVPEKIKCAGIIRIAQ
ncbi:major facilitator superfamily domain-containing protein [Schizophyllum fasciatum]